MLLKSAISLLVLQLYGLNEGVPEGQKPAEQQPLTLHQQ
jgi:hypothetical protein